MGMNLQKKLQRNPLCAILYVGDFITKRPILGSCYAETYYLDLAIVTANSP